VTLTDLAPDDSGEHDFDHELVARLGPTVYHLDGRDPAARAAGWLCAILAGLVLWLLIGLAVLLALD
jgi:hypothetical protein